MKLARKITEGDLKKFKQIKIRQWSAYQPKKWVVFEYTLTPQKNGVKYKRTSEWSDGRTTRNYGTFKPARAIQRINSAVVFQSSPSSTSKYDVSAE